MDLDKALRRYRENRFTDDDVIRSSGLSVRAWRELIKFGAVRTIEEGRGPGRVRVCDATNLKRAAVIAALNRAGLSLGVSGRIAYFAPYHTLLYTLCDPLTILFRHSAELDPKTGLPPRVERPKVNWFELNTPARADAETDWLVEIYDGRFVGAIYKADGKPALFGDLRERERGAKFVAWYPLHPTPNFSSATEGLLNELLPNRFAESVAQWEDPRKFPAELDLLDYKVEKRAHDDARRLAAEAVAANPIVKCSVNVSLALRKALRRYLRIEPASARS